MSSKALKKILCCFVVLSVFWMSVDNGQAAELALGSLPQAGTMMTLSAPFHPAMLKGILVDPKDSFKLDFIVDEGERPGSSDVRRSTSDDFKSEANKLIRYFLASLTVPENDLWVNLSPYEKEKIIPDAFGMTEMGRDLLGQDYVLKQLASSLIYPEKELGKKFWDEVYRRAFEKFGTTDIPMDTFNKVWIVPEKAVVYEKTAGSRQQAAGEGSNTQGSAVAYVVDAKLKVMLESDYLAASKQGAGDSEPGELNHEATAATSPSSQALAKDVLREVIIPILEKEVNEGANFATLRQIYNAMILAAWFKVSLKNSILGQVYADQNKVKGVDLAEPQAKQKIYEQYLAAFKKGVFNYIKEEYDPLSQETLPRKYFSGGFDPAQLNEKVAKGLIHTVDATTFASTVAGPVRDVRVRLTTDVIKTASSPQALRIDRQRGNTDQAMKASGLERPASAEGQMYVNVVFKDGREVPVETILSNDWRRKNAERTALRNLSNVPGEAAVYWRDFRKEYLEKSEDIVPLDRTPVVSFVIPTLAGRQNSILKRIKEVKDSQQPSEILIVIANEEKFASGEIEKIRAAIRDAKVPARLLYPKLNRIAVNRNLGTSFASGEFVIFLDDDVSLRGNSVMRIKQAFDANEQIGLIGVPSFDEQGGFYKPRHFELKQRIHDDLLLVNNLGGMLMATRRNIALRAPFPNFWSNYGEDSQLARSIRSLGYGAVFLDYKDAFLIHEDVETRSSLSGVQMLIDAFLVNYFAHDYFISTIEDLFLVRLQRAFPGRSLEQLKKIWMGILQLGQDVLEEQEKEYLELAGDPVWDRLKVEFSKYLEANREAIKHYKMNIESLRNEGRDLFRDDVLAGKERADRKENPPPDRAMLAKNEVTQLARKASELYSRSKDEMEFSRELDELAEKAGWIHVTHGYGDLLEKAGRALIVTGMPAAGKSKMAYALSKQGFTYISSDGMDMLQSYDGKSLIAGPRFFAVGDALTYRSKSLTVKDVINKKLRIRPVFVPVSGVVVLYRSETSPEPSLKQFAHLYQLRDSLLEDFPVSESLLAQFYDDFTPELILSLALPKDATIGTFFSMARQISAFANQTILGEPDRAMRAEEAKNEVGRIYDIYEQLVKESGKPLPVSRDKLVKRVALRTTARLHFIAGVGIAIAGTAMLVAHSYDLDFDDIGILCALYLFLDQTLDPNRAGGYRPLTRRIVINRFEKQSTDDLLPFMAHEIAHALKLPNNLLYANAYSILSIIKMGDGDLLNRRLGRVNPSDFRGVKKYNAIDFGLFIARTVRQLFPNDPLAMQEAVLRNFLQAYLNAKLNLNERTELLLDAVRAGLTDKDYSIPRVRSEGRNPWAYAYGSGMALLAFSHYGNADDALRYIYRLAQAKDSRSADRAMREDNDLGGIDLTAKNLGLEVHRDGNGNLLPLTPEQLKGINLDGLAPVIINITPVEDLLMLLGQKEEPSGTPVGQTDGSHSGQGLSFQSLDVRRWMMACSG